MDAAIVSEESSPDAAVLADGRAVLLRPVTSASKPLIAAALLRLSPESSRRRFFTPRFRLSDAELDRLTDLDGIDRYAIGAIAVGADGRTEGIGVARYAREADEPRAAEAAVVVIDEYQGLGLGKLLLRRLAAAALQRGIDRLRGIVLRDNDPMLGLLARHAPGLALIRTQDHLQVEVPLDGRSDPHSRVTRVTLPPPARISTPA
jgi:GNAT superfamily N-acetyltransferase